MQRSKAEKLYDAVDIPVPLEVDSDLTEHERAIFDMYATGKARPDWLDHELMMLAQLARCTAKIQKLQAQLRKEPEFYETVTGTLRRSPTFDVIKSLTGDQIQMIKVLRLSTAGTGSLKKVQTNAKHAAKLRRDLARTQKSSNVSLLATPD